MKIYKASSYRQILHILQKIQKQHQNTNTNILFRGSPYLKKVLHPREYSRGKYVFASNLVDLAISYIRCGGGGGTQEDVAQAVRVDPETGEPVVHLVEIKKDGIKRMFQCGGYLYLLDQSKFKKSKFSQLKNYEFLSTKIQKPLAIIQISKLYLYSIIKEVAKRGGIKLHPRKSRKSRT